MNKLIKILPLLATGVALVGCQDEDFGFKAEDIKYQTEFAKAFGKIDPEQDFNLATRATVSVSTSTPSNIKIYAKFGDRFKLVGDYAEITGTQTLGIDVVEGTTELRVSNGSFAQETVVGGSVSFDGNNLTRGILNTSISEKQTEWKEMSHALLSAWLDFIPERGTRTEATAYGTNLNKVIQDFTYVSNGDFVMYPMYSCTNASDIIGIYYTDASGVYHEIDVMDNSFSGEELQYKRYKDEVGNPDTDWQNVTGHYATYGENTIGSTDGTHILDNISDVRGKGVKISLPKGTVFGMYLINGSNKFYSESALNTDVAVTDTDNGSSHTITVDPTKRACHASSFFCKVDGVDYQFLGFEDWHNGDFPTQSSSPSDFDLNDFMVLFAGNLPHVNDEETPGWVLAYEDLGNTFDWDYNDIVAKVQHVSGQEYATFTALAAVGTLDSYVKYGANYITGTKATSEIHKMFGATDAAPHAIINGYSKGEVSKPIVFAVPSDFSMTNLGNVSEMGGITLVVENNGEKVADVEYAAAGNTPKVICLPEFWYDAEMTYKYEWAWPTEHSSIKHVYPEFAGWVASKTTNTDWYKHPTTNCTPGQAGEVANNEKGSYVSGSFKVKLASGTISESANPQPYVIRQRAVYMAANTSISWDDVFTTQSAGKLEIKSANSSVVQVASNNSTFYAPEGAEGSSATVTIRQQVGNDKTEETKIWPLWEETITFTILRSNTISLGIIDGANFTSKTEISIALNDEVNLYFKSDAQNNALTTYSVDPQNAFVSIGDVEASSILAADGYATVTGTQVGTTTITVNQDRTNTYAASSKTITVHVTAPEISCTVSDRVNVTVWGTQYHGQTITIPATGVEAGDILKIVSGGENKDFGTEYGNSSYGQGNKTEIKITEAMIGNMIYVTLYGSDEITKATIAKPQS